MTLLYGAVQGVRAIKAQSLAVHEAKQQRYYLMAGGQYLHQECKHLQSGKAYAWSGTMEQTVNCRRAHPAAAGCRTHPIISIPKHVQEPA